MSGGAYWTWFALWTFAMCITPPSRDQKGYIWRFLRRHVFVWRRGMSIVDRLMRALMLYMTWGMALAVALDPPLLWAAYFGGLAVIQIDDYLNGDDDQRRRRREWVRNKIRWLMELPLPPRPQEVRW